ncbi:hypothetical protein K438DRAFT_1969548 [Mycena galopus ATCC 62051]|nr:hypothetical protein K438DRAFT_1969548 [Mycena galopus ATCC 62051]
MAAVFDADDVALRQDRPQLLFGPIVENYTSAATLTVEAPEKVAVQRSHNEDMDSPSSAAFVSHPNTRPFAFIAVAIIIGGAALDLVKFKRGVVLLVLLRD